MKPRFALNLTHDKAALLHRSGRNWQAVGEAAFDAPDLVEAMSYLRSTALGLSPKGMATKVVIPNSQILYAEIEAPGPDIDNRRAQIATALEGRTPYAVEDLVFDWSGDGPMVKVAVVARETLDEAEAFAVEHRFNPVSFVAIPEGDAFKGEPWFGPTAVSATILAPGETIERDTAAISVPGRSPAKSGDDSDAARPAEKPQENAAPAPEASAPEAAAEAAPEAAEAEAGTPKAETAAPAQSEPEPATEAAAETAPETADKTAGTTSAEPAPEVAAAPDKKDSGAAEPPAEAPEATAPEKPAADASPLQLTHKKPPPVAAAPPADEEAPFTHVADPAPASAPAAPAPAPVSVLQDELPPEPSAAARLAFASRRAAETNGKAAPLAAKPAEAKRGSTVAMPSLVAERLAARAKDKPADIAAPDPATRPAPAGPTLAGKAKPAGGLVTAPSIPGMKKRKGIAGSGATGSGAMAAQITDSIPRKPLTKPGGTFAGKPAPSIGGKPRYLGLILTGMLLLLLAIAAAWSSYFLASNRAADGDTDLAAITSPDDEMLADGVDPADLDPAAFDPTAEGLADGLPETAATILPEPDLPPDTAVLDEAGLPADDLPSASETVTIDEPLLEDDPASATATATPAPDPSPGTQVAADVAQRAIADDAQDEIFLSAMDQPPPQRDAAALPGPTRLRDSLPAAQMPPPPFGTVYEFDAAGLIRPTPEGIMTPEGVRIVAGSPAIVPPERPAGLAPAAAAAVAAAVAEAVAPDETADAVADAAAASPDAAAEPAAPAADPALAGARPRARPATDPAPAVQAEDDAAVDTATNARFAAFRPRLRPASILAAGEESRRASQGASLAAEGATLTLASAAAPAIDPNRSRLAVAVSRKPAARPKDLSKAVEAAVAAAVRQPDPRPETQAEPEETAAARPQRGQIEPEQEDEPEVVSAAPKIPTRSSVAKTATFANAINLSKTNLIGVYGTQSKRYALIRQSNGRYKKVKVGDRIDGGTIQAITASEVRYQKGGRLITLALPKG